jgi:lipoic acid synthetase
MTYPDWLSQLIESHLIKISTAQAGQLACLIHSYNLKTVCQSARCPNRGRCWSGGAATFMVLGDICTRSCRFCNLFKGRPEPVDEDEPWRLLQAVRALWLQHVIITSVTRDDLADGGAGHFGEIIRTLRRGSGRLTIEVLTPDFLGRPSSLEQVAAAVPDIWGHNLETVPRLYKAIRPGADYDRSLKLLATIKDLHGEIRTKSGLMLGLGETTKELEQVLRDLRQAGVDHLTLGQYLAPSRQHYPIARYATPAEFDQWREEAAALGFDVVQSGPLVRSSYRFELQEPVL